MYNLLVKGDGWGQGRDIMPLERVFEYTNDDLRMELVENNNIHNLDIDLLKNIPSVFLHETIGDRNRIVYFGSLTNIEVNRGNVTLEYVYDNSLPSITNGMLEDINVELDIRDFEFSRTHWAVKNIDLYKILYRHLFSRRQQSDVFHLQYASTIQENLVSVMMPYDNKFNQVYEKLQETCASIGLRCIRADDIWENHMVIQDIVSLIDRSNLVICDCTGRNSNVFYETGIAHSLGRKVILITQDGGDIPFDLKHLRDIQYENTDDGLAQLEQAITARINYLIN